jgi:DNA-binding GntR family transcriptional regulator
MSTSIDLIEEFIKKNIDNYDHEPGRLSDVAHECLKDAILCLDVRSGDPLSEVRLSKALNISRTPLRAAFQQLAQEGLIHIIPGRTAVIASRSPRQLLDALGVRMLLEPELCRLVAGALSEEQRNLLDDYTNQLAKAAEARDRATWTQVDVKWHQTICEACPNQLLGEMVFKAWQQMRIQGVVTRMSDESLIPGTQEHRAIADAIANGDRDRAAELMLSHLHFARERMFLLDL